MNFGDGVGGGYRLGVGGCRNERGAGGRLRRRRLSIPVKGGRFGNRDIGGNGRKVAGFLLLDLVLEKLGLDLEIGQLLTQALGLDAELLSLLLADFDLLLHHDPSLDGLVELGLHVLQRRGRVTRLSLIVIVGDLDVSELELQAAVCVS